MRLEGTHANYSKVIDHTSNVQGYSNLVYSVVNKTRHLETVLINHPSSPLTM